MWYNNAVLYYRGSFYPKSSFLVEDGLFKEILTESTSPFDTKGLDLNGQIVVPGFIDQHIHGSIGLDFMDANPESNKIIAKYLPKLGVTSFLATTLTASFEETEKAISAINTAFESDVESAAECIGIHLEGPFLNKEKKGAHSEKWLIDPEISLIMKCIDLSKIPIKMVTYAPELDEKFIFTKYLVSNKIVASIGHSLATYGIVKEAVANGASCITHCYNAMRPLSARDGGVLGAALEIDFLYAEIIADLIHVSEENIRLFHRCKPKAKRILVSDAMRARGVPPGNFMLGSLEAVSNGTSVTLKNGALAGSLLKPLDALRNYTQVTSSDLEEAINALTENPAKLLGIYERKGSIEIGKDADFVIIDKDFNLVETFCKGQKTGV